MAADNRIGNSRVSLRLEGRQHRHIALGAALEGWNGLRWDGLHSVLEAWRQRNRGRFSSSRLFVSIFIFIFCKKNNSLV
jgi:hypothetical protein